MVYSRLVELSYHTKISQRRLKTMSDNIIQLNGDLIKHDLKDPVRSSVEEILNDGRLEGHALEAGHVQGYVTGGGGQVALVVAAAVRLPLFSALIPRRLGQLLGFFLQQAVERFFYAARTNSLI